MVDGTELFVVIAERQQANSTSVIGMRLMLGIGGPAMSEEVRACSACRRVFTERYQVRRFDGGYHLSIRATGDCVPLECLLPWLEEEIEKIENQKTNSSELKEGE